MKTITSCKRNENKRSGQGKGEGGKGRGERGGRKVNILTSERERSTYCCCC